MVVTDPEQLGSIPSGRSHQRELLHQVSHYGIDTNDALILMEATSCGRGRTSTSSPSCDDPLYASGAVAQERRDAVSSER